MSTPIKIGRVGGGSSRIHNAKHAWFSETYLLVRPGKPLTHQLNSFWECMSTRNRDVTGTWLTLSIQVHIMLVGIRTPKKRRLARCRVCSRSIPPHLSVCTRSCNIFTGRSTAYAFVPYFQMLCSIILSHIPILFIYTVVPACLSSSNLSRCAWS